MAEPSIQKNTSNDPNSPKENSTSSSSSWPTEMHPLSQNNSQKPPLPAAAAAANDSSQKQNTTPARPTKRQKVSLACQECRSRKTKCDGVRPVCGSCAKKPRLEGSCVYEPERGKRGIKNQYVQLLENKVRELENAMRQDQPVNLVPPTETNLSIAAKPLSLVPSHTPSSVSLVKPRLPTIACAGETPENSHHSSSPAAPVSNVRTLPQIDNQTWVENSSAASQNSTIDSEHPASILTPQPQDRSETQEEEEEQVDAMGAGNPKGSKNYASDSGTHGYFGASSAMSFMRELQEVISKRAPALSPENFPSNSSLFNSSIPSNQNANRSRGRLSLTGMSLDCGRSSYPGILHDFVLPPRKVADGLVWSYWTLVHTLYPFLHKESFMKTYSKLWEDSNDVENMDEDTATIHSGSARGSIQTGANEYPYKEKEEHEYESENDLLFQCILNLVFALGCQLSPEISESERELASDVFFQRSKKLLHIDILDVGNLKVIQALLLMGQYLQCTKMPKRCWIVVGLATRVAQGLGLHLETGIDQHNHSRASDNCGQLNRELRRRLWGGCIVLDRVISMSYGRPFMIPVTRNLVLPQIIDDELLTTDPCLSAVQPDDKPSYMAFFVNTLQLYEIMGDILVTLYSIEAKKSPDDGLTSGQNTPNHFPRADIEERNRNRNLNSVLRLEMSLHSWKKALPPCLLPETYTDKDTANIPPYRRGYTTDHILFRQANVLQARYLHTCILLYRPFFVYCFAMEEAQTPTSDFSGMDLPRSLFFQSSESCVKVAQQLVDIIHRNIGGLLPAWWYNIFYLYTSATVLLMARLLPKMKQAIGENKLIESWNKCLGCLEEYQSYSGSAKCCYESLKELDRLAFQNDNVNRPTSGMSGIQILNTLPNYTNPNQFSNPLYRQNENGNIPHSVDNPYSSFHEANQNQWEVDLQDMSWLGRLPVYNDLEPGVQFNQWLGRFYSDVNML